MSGAEDVVAAARRWIGTPYRHQASLRGAGTDCLGLVRGLWRELVGPEPVTPPPYTPDWDELQGREVLWAAALAHLRPLPGRHPAPGDVILFRMRSRSVAKHLGIAARREDGLSFVHAWSGRGVVETALTASWARRVVARFAFPLGD